jgi:hypothetical protein
MRLLGTTQRWYHEASPVFWAGATPGQQPTFEPDQRVLREPFEA